MKKLFFSLIITAGLFHFNTAFSQTTLVGTWENTSQKSQSDGKPTTEYWRFTADTMYWMQGPLKMAKYDPKELKNKINMKYVYKNDTIYGGTFAKLRVNELTIDKLIISFKMGKESKTANFKRVAKK